MGASGAPFLPQPVRESVANATPNTHIPTPNSQLPDDAGCLEVGAAFPPVGTWELSRINLLRCYRAGRVAHDVARQLPDRLESGATLRRLEPARVDAVAAHLVVQDPLGRVEQARRLGAVAAR